MTNWDRHKWDILLTLSNCPHDTLNCVVYRFRTYDADCDIKMDCEECGIKNVEWLFSNADDTEIEFEEFITLLEDYTSKLGKWYKKYGQKRND